MQKTVSRDVLRFPAKIDEKLRPPDLRVRVPATGDLGLDWSPKGVCGLGVSSAVSLRSFWHPQDLKETPEETSRPHETPRGVPRRDPRAERPQRPFGDQSRPRARRARGPLTLTRNPKPWKLQQKNKSAEISQKLPRISGLCRLAHAFKTRSIHSTSRPEIMTFQILKTIFIVCECHFPGVHSNLGFTTTFSP